MTAYNEVYSQKFYLDASGKKYYRTYLRAPGKRAHMLIKTHRTATAAIDYGHAVLQRYERLKAVVG
jgi:hypothetical protein